MTSILERREDERISCSTLMKGRDDKSGTWARMCAATGAAVWAGVAVLARIGMARIGAIELLFLFAPLVIVPLGVELGRLLGRAGRLDTIGRRVQPLAAALAVVALLLPPGRFAALLAAGWMTACLAMAGSGVAGLVRSSWSEADRSVRSPLVFIAIAIARIDLMVGGVWFVASRLGMRPLGIQEPIELLTAVHFHFAGFATATIAAAMLQFAEKRGKDRWLRRLVPLVIGMPFVVAAGFVISPVLKMGAAVVFSASVAGLAVALRWCGKRAEAGAARVLLQVAAVCGFAGMVLSGAYAIADYLGSNVLIIPQMARTHGILNAVGFCLCGLLGWLVDSSSQ
jgi:YndJ-like protein